MSYHLIALELERISSLLFDIWCDIRFIFEANCPRTFAALNDAIRLKKIIFTFKGIPNFKS